MIESASETIARMICFTSAGRSNHLVIVEDATDNGEAGEMIDEGSIRNGIISWSAPRSTDRYVKRVDGLSWFFVSLKVSKLLPALHSAVKLPQ